ncbi:MAG: type II CAAX endopeptidase family protein [Nitriliruptoraceae bacterium]
MSLLDAGMAITAYFVGQLTVGVFVGVGSQVAGRELSDTGWMILALVATTGGLLFALGWLRLRGRLTAHLWGPEPGGARAVMLGLVFGVLGTLLTYLLNGAVGFITEIDGGVEQQVVQDAMSGGTSLLLAVIVAVVLAPIAEELLFRGLLFPALRRWIGLWPAAVLSSVAFTVVHVEIVLSQPLALVGLFAFGILLAWTHHRFGNLLVPIIAHAMFNSLSLTLVLALDRLGIVVG